MLTKGFKDEEQKKLDQVLNAGFQLEFVPDLWEKDQREKLDDILEKTVNFTLDAVESLSTEDLLKKLEGLNLSFSNYEHFADLLVKTIPLEKGHQANLAEKAVAVYEAAQQESNTFSFALVQKINTAKRKL